MTVGECFKVITDLVGGLDEGEDGKLQHATNFYPLHIQYTTTVQYLKPRDRRI